MADNISPQPSEQRFGEPLTVGGVIIPIDIDITQAEEKLRQWKERLADDPASLPVTASAGGGSESEDIASLLEGITAQIEELKAQVTSMADAIRSLAENGISVSQD